MTDQVLETWQINNRINLRLIDRISDAGMRSTLSRRGGRNVVRQFVRLHNVCMWHLSRRAKPLMSGAHTSATDDEFDRRGLAATLESHHRGSILPALKQCGHRLDSATPYGLWDWDRL